MAVAGRERREGRRQGRLRGDPVVGAVAPGGGDRVLTGTGQARSPRSSLRRCLPMRWPAMPYSQGRALRWEPS